MAENIKKLKFEPGDARDTSDRPMTCPNGHTIKRSRGGHLNCTVCDWSDKNKVMGTKPVNIVGKNEPTTPQNPQAPGVSVISSAGVDHRRKPNIVSR